MWSIGCILGEMLLGKPLFPGTSTVNQIEQILRVISPPSPEDVAAFHSDYRASLINRLSCQQQVTFEDLLPASTPPQALDLLKRLLVFNPEKRLTAEEALEHPYVRRFRCPTQEPALPCSVLLPLDDDVQLSVAEYRNKLYEMILERKAQNRQQRRAPLRPASSVASPSLEAISERQGVPRPLPPSGSPQRLGATAACGTSQQRTSETGRPKISSAACSPTAHVAGRGSLAAGHVAARNLCVPLLPQPAAALHRRVGEQPSCLPVSSPAPLHGVPKGPERQSQAPSQPRPLSLSGQAQEAVLNQPLMRMEPPFSKAGEPPRNSESHGREAHPVPKPCRKMFQVTANVGTAGDAKARLGSYSQSYGTICKSALQSLPVANGCQRLLAPNSPQL